MLNDFWFVKNISNNSIIQKSLDFILLTKKVLRLYHFSN